MDPTRRIEWNVVRVMSAKPRPGRKHEPAIQLSTSKSEPIRVSYGVGVLLEGEFRSRSFIDDRDISDYLELLRDAATWVKVEWAKKGSGLHAKIADFARVGKAP